MADDNSENPDREELPLIVEPKDKFHIVYISFILVGAGFLFPYNSFIAAADYFLLLYPTKYPEVVLPFVYISLTTLSILINVFTVELFPIHARLGFGYGTFIIALITIPLLDIGVSNCSLDVNVSFSVTLLCVILVGIGCGIQQSSYYGLAGMLPKRFTQALMTGEGVAGIVVSLNRIITKLAIKNEQLSSKVFFVISLIFVCSCIALQVFLWKSSFVRYYIHKCNKNLKREDEELLIDEMEDTRDETVDTRDEMEDNSSDRISRQSFGKVIRKWILKFTNSKKLKSFNLKDVIQTRLRLIRIIWKNMLTGFYMFLITLLLYPGLTTLVQDCSIGDWLPVILVTLFNAADLIGKVLSAVPIKWNSWAMLVIAASRTLLVPLLLLTVVPSPTYPLVHSPWLAGAVVVTVAVTGGYFGSVAMIQAPTIVPDNLREMTGTLMTFSLLAGLMIGAALDYSLVPLTQLRETLPCKINNTEEPLLYCVT